MLIVSVLLDEVFEDLCAVFVTLSEFEKGEGDSLLEDFVATVAHKHDQLCCQVNAVLQSDFHSNRFLLKEVIDSLGIGFEVIDLIGRQGGRLLNLLHTW